MSEKALTDGPPTPVPPPSAPALTQRTSSRTRLTFPGVASIFVGLKRAQSRASLKAAKAGDVHSDSGDAPITHAGFASDGAVSPRQVPINREDMFVCAGGVDTVKLVRLARESLLQSAVAIGANVLLNERYAFPSPPLAGHVMTWIACRWACDIHEPKRGDGNYRVHVSSVAPLARPLLISQRLKVRYTASAARSNKPDLRKPVALENAKGVPGLMTVVQRQSRA